MDAKLWELDNALQDAHEALNRAGELAARISGSRPSRAADPEYGCPADEGEEGWPLMNWLCDALVGLDVTLQTLRTNEQLVEAIEAERAEDDEHEARADAASY
jgi:hypothetical protein